MNGDVSCIAFGPSFGGSSLLVSAGDDGFVRLWNLNYCPKASIGEEPRAICFLTLPLSGPMHLPSPSPTFPDGSNALPSPFSSQTSSPSEMSHVTFSPCGRFIAAASVDGSVTEFDIEDHLRTYRLSSIATSHINGGGSNPVVDTDGGPAASISPWYESPSPGHQNWQPLSPRTSEVGSKTSTISPRVSMAGSKPLPNGGSCTAVDRLRVEALPGPDQHTKGVTALAFNPEPRFGPDGDRRASKKSSGGGHESILSAVTGGSFMATGSADCTCRLWHLDSARCVAVMAEHKDALTAVAWSPDCRYVATASLDSTALVYDVSYVIELCLKGQVQGVEVGGCKWIANLAGHEEAVTCLTWSPRGRGVLVTGSKDGTIKFWDVSKIGVGALCTVTLYEAHLHSQGGTTGLSYSRDGALLASVGTDRYLKVSPSCLAWL